MLRLICALMLVFAAVPASGQAQPQKIESLAPEMDRIFEEFHRLSEATGLVYGIVADGRLVHSKGFGVQDLKAKRPVTGDSLFRIASMSKAFTALAILKLRDEGKVSLDAVAETYVPEMQGWRYPTADSPRIRVRDLLNHTAGFVTDDPWGDRQQVLSEADFTAMLKAGVPFTRAPGVAMEYSNFGYALLGRIITNVSGMPYDQYISRTIQRPLGMSSTGYEVRDWPLERRAIGYRLEDGRQVEEPTMRHGTFGAMGGVQTSANDYAKWIGFLLSAWPPRDEAERGPVRRATVRELVQGSNFPTPARRPGRTGGAECPRAQAYGMGLIALTDCELGSGLMHGGGYPGYGSHMMLLTDYGVGIFVFSNRTYNGGAGPAWDAAAALHKAGALVRRTVPVSDGLARAYRAAGEIYAAARLDPGRQLLAMNFLMDRSAENWARDLAGMKGQIGTCDTSAPIVPNGALSGTFEWTCAKGKMHGQVLLAPTHQPSIQALRFNPVPNSPPAGQ